MNETNHADSELAIQDRVMVEADVYGRQTLFRAMIVKVCPDELWLGLASPDRRLETMRQEQELRLTVARTGAALLGESTYLRPLGGSKSRIFAVRRPGSMARVQRRAHTRYQIDLPVLVRHMDEASREPKGKAVVAKTVNVSPGGLLMETEIAVALDEELAFTMPLIGEDRLSMLGVVTRVRGAEDGSAGEAAEGGLTEVAIRFSRITSVDQERLVRFVLMTAHRRREAAQQRLPVPVPAPAAPAPAAPAPLVAPAEVARSAAPLPAAPTSAPSRPTEPALLRPPVPKQMNPNEPLIQFGLQLCEDGEAQDVRSWFDGLMPGARIELLSLLQANMAGGAVPGASEPASVRPLAVALGLLAA